MTTFPPKPDPQEAFAMLKAGNARFAAVQNDPARFDADYRLLLAKGKRSDHVLATVVGCSDSRVTPEFVFNSNPGDLFVIRTAGFACLSTESLASVHFGVVHLESSLLVVLGHTDCKAVKIASEMQDVNAETSNPPLQKTLGTLADTLEPHVDEMQLDDEITPEALDEIIKKNVFLTIDRIRESSPEIRRLQDEGKVLVIPALYNLETGLVEWL